eukprot:3349989-Alexandrium_andersonii.AAC.1
MLTTLACSRTRGHGATSCKLLGHGCSWIKRRPRASGLTATCPHKWALGAGIAQLFLRGCRVQAPTHVAHGAERRARRCHHGHERAELSEAPQHPCFGTLA